MTMIASIGTEIPQDLLAATGRYADPLGWNVDRDFPRAQQWLESKFARWSFSILEDWAAGAFDALGAVVFSRGDDSAQRLYYYVCELRRRGAIAGPEPLIFDVATIDRPSSEDHCIAAVRRLAERLAVSDEALETAIVATNARRRRTVVSAPGDRRTCLLAGTPPPDRRLHDAIERVGWNAAGPTLRDGWARLGAPVDEASGDPAAALGRQVHVGITGPRGFFDRGAALAREAQATNAAAVVLWCAEEDEAQVWHVPDQRAALAEIDMPALVLTRRDWTARDAADTEITAFLRGVDA